MLINEELMYIDKEFSNVENLFNEMANDFFNKGYVLESYKKALFDREAIFPTGLKVENCGLAIPHTDSEHIKKSGIAVIRLKDPVEFKEMCTNKPVQVKLIFFLLVKDKEKQVVLLSNLMGLFSNKEVIKSLLESDSEKEFYQILVKEVGGKQ